MSSFTLMTGNFFGLLAVSEALKHRRLHLPLRPASSTGSHTATAMEVGEPLWGSPSSPPHSFLLFSHGSRNLVSPLRITMILTPMISEIPV